MSPSDRAKVHAYIVPDVVSRTLVEMIDIRSPTGHEAGMADYIVHRLRRAGIDASLQFPDRAFADIEDVLSRNWNRARGRSSLKWTKARLAVQDSWTRTCEIVAAAKAAAAAALESEKDPAS